MNETSEQKNAREAIDRAISSYIDPINKEHAKFQKELESLKKEIRDLKLHVGINAKKITLRGLGNRNKKY